jgi:hypothetical protein
VAGMFEITTRFDWVVTRRRNTPFRSGRSRHGISRRQDSGSIWVVRAFAVPIRPTKNPVWIPSAARPEYAMRIESRTSSGRGITSLFFRASNWKVTGTPATSALSMVRSTESSSTGPLSESPAISMFPRNVFVG